MNAFDGDLQVPPQRAMKFFAPRVAKGVAFASTGTDLF